MSEIRLHSRRRAATIRRFIEGEDRTQATLLPERIDDYITEESAVRVIDEYVDEYVDELICRILASKRFH